MAANPVDDATQNQHDSVSDDCLAVLCLILSCTLCFSFFYTALLCEILDLKCHNLCRLCYCDIILVLNDGQMLRKMYINYSNKNINRL